MLACLDYADVLTRSGVIEMEVENAPPAHSPPAPDA
jgi:hypothetical protein